MKSYGALPSPIPILFTLGIFIGNVNQFLSGVTNCDLDTGRDLQTGNLIYWS